MLRLLVLTLVLANIGYFFWTQGALAVLGLAPASQSEAFRISQQIRPEALQLLPNAPAASAPAAPALSTAAPLPTAAASDTTAQPATPASAAVLAAESAAATASAARSAGSGPAAAPLLPASLASPAAGAAPAASSTASSTASSSTAPAVAIAAPGECLQAGLFTDAQANLLRTRLQTSLPEGSWVLNAAVEPARWIIYMGRYADEDTLAKKRNELRARGVRYEPVQNTGLNPGLSLGHFETKLDADRELARDAERGVRTARVILERGEVRGQRLVLPAASAAVKAQIVALKPQLAGKALTACPKVV